jgi:hypothetical protein
MSAILSALFIACALVCFLNVRRLWIDKSVVGVSLIPTVVFITTNVFEIVYFTRLDDMLPVIGASLMLIVNVAWLGLAIFYRIGDDINRFLDADFA